MAEEDVIDALFWKEVHAAGAGKAIASAWVEFETTSAGMVIKANGKAALRLSIKYRDTGPYLSIETAPGSGESMGSCVRTSEMVKHYERILEAHNALGEHLHAARSFMISNPVAA